MLSATPPTSAPPGQAPAWRDKLTAATGPGAQVPGTPPSDGEIDDCQLARRAARPPSMGTCSVGRTGVLRPAVVGDKTSDGLRELSPSTPHDGSSNSMEASRGFGAW